MENGTAERVSVDQREFSRKSQFGKDREFGLSIPQSRGDHGDLNDAVISLSKENDARDTSFINANCKRELKDTCDNCTKNSEHKSALTPVNDSGYHTRNATPPEARGTNDLFSDRILQNGYQNRTLDFENRSSSTESYTERFLRSGAWPLAEGSDRVQLSTSNEYSIEKSREKRVGENSNDQNDNYDDNDSNEEKKGFSFRTLTREQIVILIATSFTNLLSFLSLSVLAPFFPIEVSIYLVLNFKVTFLFRSSPCPCLKK